MCEKLQHTIIQFVSACVELAIRSCTSIYTNGNTRCVRCVCVSVAADAIIEICVPYRACVWVYIAYTQPYIRIRLYYPYWIGSLYDRANSLNNVYWQEFCTSHSLYNKIECVSVCVCVFNFAYLDSFLCSILNIGSPGLTILLDLFVISFAHWHNFVYSFQLNGKHKKSV